MPGVNFTSVGLLLSQALKICRRFGIVFLIPVIFLFCTGKKTGSEKKDMKITGEIIVFHAGSLSVPFQEIARKFEEENPAARVLLEAAGSVACARKITDLGKPCDIMASSDYRVIEELMIPGHAVWHMPFAANDMVIAYNDKSGSAENISSENWHQVLMDQTVSFGRSDPDSDPCGYRTVMTFQLSESHYGITGLADRLENKDRKYIRPKEVDLLALLEIGEIDYIFIYRSVAVQHQLNYLALPREINLGDPALDSIYRQASVEIRGGKPGETLTMNGEAMVYSATIPVNSPNPSGAQAFMSFLLHPEKGMKIMEESGQKSLVPYRNTFYDKLPAALKTYAIR
jgi:molybdate/tungstate transport system substrate-binding protein